MKEEAKDYPQTSPITPINLTSMIEKQIFKIVANQYLAKSRNCLIRQFFDAYRKVLRVYMCLILSSCFGLLRRRFRLDLDI